jgi:hypothetical protein
MDEPPLAPGHEAPLGDEPSERERQLLEYLIERAWESCLRTLREHRPDPDLDRTQQEEQQ